MAAATDIKDIAATMSDHSSARTNAKLSFVGVFARMATVGLLVLAALGQSTDLDTFAKCLADKKATMYGSFLCSHCNDQKKLFGSSFRYVPYVECSQRGSRDMTFPCMAAEIRYTPTWIFADGERRTGIQPLKDLSQKTGCKLP
ncbi:MAG TPA: hypothetical protein VGS27_18135 [Candidatus Sulfotelmatobacter sp.]|nr:hypothetical protein [Candidatus Sulfotelmatobacter sp.]